MNQPHFGLLGKHRAGEEKGPSCFSLQLFFPCEAAFTGDLKELQGVAALLGLLLLLPLLLQGGKVRVKGEKLHISGHPEV